MNKRQELEAARNLEPDCPYGAVGAGRYTTMRDREPHREPHVIREHQIAIARKTTAVRRGVTNSRFAIRFRWECETCDEYGGWMTQAEAEAEALTHAEGP